LKENENCADALIEKRIRKAGDERVFCNSEALRRGVTIETIHEWTKIDLWFLHKLAKLIQFEEQLKNKPFDSELGRKAKELGFSDYALANVWDSNEKAVYQWRREKGIIPVFKMVDTCAAEFESH